jgi:hypothetical protein
MAYEIIMLYHHVDIDLDLIIILFSFVLPHIDMPDKIGGKITRK